MLAESEPEDMLSKIKVLQVLYTPPTNPLPSDKCAYELSRSMTKMGVDVHCLYPGDKARASIINSIHFRSLPFPSKFPHFVRGLIFNFAILRFVITMGRRYDLIHIHDSMVVLAFIIARTLNVIKAPIVMHIHGTWMHIYTIRKPKLSIIKSLNALLGSIFEFWGYHIADICVAVSYNALRNARETYLVSPSKVHVIYNGVDLDKHKQRSCIKSATCLFVGADFYRKGLDILIRAFEIVIKKVPEAKLFVVGGRDPEMEKLAEKLKRRGNNIFFLGRITENELNGLYDLCRVFVLPSFYEAFGLVLLEAMAHGKPVVSTKTSAIPEVITDGETGILVELGNISQLAEAIIELLTDDSLYYKMSKHALERARMFTWDKSAEKLVHVYRQLLRRVYATSV